MKTIKLNTAIGMTVGMTAGSAIASSFVTFNWMAIKQLQKNSMAMLLREHTDWVTEQMVERRSEFSEEFIAEYQERLTFMGAAQDNLFGAVKDRKWLNKLADFMLKDMKRRTEGI